MVVELESDSWNGTGVLWKFYKFIEKTPKKLEIYLKSEKKLELY